MAVSGTNMTVVDSCGPLLILNTGYLKSIEMWRGMRRVIKNSQEWAGKY